MLSDPLNEVGHPVEAVQAPIFTSNIPVSPKIELSGNLANNWKQWKQVWSTYELVFLGKVRIFCSFYYEVCVFVGQQIKNFVQ